MNPPKAVSLFAGIGGICMGFKQAGFQIVWANEKDPAASRTYRYNFGNDYLVEGDIRKIDKSSIPSADILIAGFPCQSFSVGGKAKGFSDPRGQLFFEVINVAYLCHQKKDLQANLVAIFMFVSWCHIDCN